MAEILADNEINNLIGKVILGGDPEYLNPNGIELRLGDEVLFHSTKETLPINDGDYIKVGPGENVTISSLEEIDFSEPTLRSLYEHKQLMGLITPTTTMMREGISQVTTKIDSGYKGHLNWSFRNNSFKDILIEKGEPIYKLTLFLVDTSEGSREKPDKLYGERNRDQYQDGNGIQPSNRVIKADIANFVEPKIKVDPKIQLKDAGFPHNRMAEELENIRYEVRSSIQGAILALPCFAGIMYGAVKFLDAENFSPIIVNSSWIVLGVLGLAGLNWWFKRKN